MFNKERITKRLEKLTGVKGILDLYEDDSFEDDHCYNYYEPQDNGKCFILRLTKKGNIKDLVEVG